MWAAGTARGSAASLSSSAFGSRIRAVCLPTTPSIITDTPISSTYLHATAAALPTIRRGGCAAGR
jgi:hypothetical protein